MGGTAFMTIVTALMSEQNSEQSRDEANDARKRQENLQAQALKQQQDFLNQPAMPVPDEAAGLAARRRSIAASVSRRGRASTILTSPDETLG